MARARGVTVGVVATLLVVWLAATSGVASAGHDPDAVDFTVTPLEDRSPGAENVQYGETIRGTAGVDLETLTRTLGIYEAGSWADCGPTSASVFGIDRGDTHDGYDIDEELTNNVKSFSAGEDRLETKYNGEDDIGASTHVDDGDEFVVVADCIDNPDTPGWYQITGRTTGVTPGGETVTFGGESHYFWICNCEDETAAREQLGPPPSEPDPTPTPATTGTTTRSADERTDTSDAVNAATATTADTPADTGPTPTPTAEASTVADAGETVTRTDPRTTTEDTASWSAVVYRTPTRSEGTGFGPVVALAALLLGALLVGRRR